MRTYYQEMFENPSPGAKYSVNQQCQFVFGPSAEICPYMVGVLCIHMKPRCLANMPATVVFDLLWLSDGMPNAAYALGGWHALRGEHVVLPRTMRWHGAQSA